MESDDLVCVYTVGNATTAEIIKNFLEDEGIRCALGDENQGALPGVIEIELFVKAEDADRASKLIAEHDH
jgi:hypothetical protein